MFSILTHNFFQAPMLLSNLSELRRLTDPNLPPDTNLSALIQRKGAKQVAVRCLAYTSTSETYLLYLSRIILPYNHTDLLGRVLKIYFCNDRAKDHRYIIFHCSCPPKGFFDTWRINTMLNIRVDEKVTQQ